MDKAKSVYRSLKQLAGANARPDLQTACFVRRKDVNREQRRIEATEADSRFHAVVAWIRWGFATTARTVSLYGESWWRVVMAAVSVIVFFGLLFPVWGIRVVGSDAVQGTSPVIAYSMATDLVGVLRESLYFSTLTFMTLSYGDLQPVGWTQTLAALESFIGVLLMAFLVFVLGRRAAR